MSKFVNDVSAGTYIGDALPPYTAWTTGVKTLGGVVTVWPFSDKNKGAPAAKFDIATYVSLFNGGKISPRDVQQATANNQYAYVLAPLDVIAAAKSLVNVTAREAAGLPGGITGWNPFKNTQLAGKVLLGAGIVGGFAALVSIFRGSRTR